MRAAVASVDQQLPFAAFRSMEDVRDGAFTLQRLETALLGALAGLALLLAAVGIYGLIANAVAERTREFGIRLALGCSRGRAVLEAAWPGIALAVAGLAGGYWLALGGGRWIESLLIGVEANDGLTFAAGAAALLAVSVAASVLPSLRIARIDPARALREE
jgi:ABC-type antimicrobial peptide transport system permease subunit